MPNDKAVVREATLQMAHGPSGQVLTARVPSDLDEAGFAAVGKSAFGLIRKLTGCNCMSGRISFVVEDNFADVIRVQLPERVATPGA
jgi:hypothetical protein